MTDCLRCGRAKYEAHVEAAPHGSIPGLEPVCPGYANVVNAEGESVYVPGGGSSGGGGASGSW